MTTSGLQVFGMGVKPSWRMPLLLWSFDTNPWHGVTLTFKRPVRFMRILRADTLTVTVTDADAFTAVLEALGIQGEDQRTRSS